MFLAIEKKHASRPDSAKDTITTYNLATPTRHTFNKIIYSQLISICLLIELYVILGFVIMTS